MTLDLGAAAKLLWSPAVATCALAAGAGLLVTGGVGLAQYASFDPEQLPAFKGKVAQYDLTPRGDVDGLILADGTEVHFAPPFGTQVVAIVRPKAPQQRA